MNTPQYSPEQFFAQARGEAEITTLLNTDAYKLYMMDFILANEQYKDLNVNREMKIRTQGIRTADVIPLEALKQQLEMTKNMPWASEEDISYLRALKKSNWEQLLKEETLEYLKTMKLPDYTIWIDETNNYTLSFEWPRPSSMMREIYGLKIINSSYMYHYIKKANLSNEEFTSIINETKQRLYDDIAQFKTQPDLKFMEFGTRRAMSTDYHRMIFDILKAELPEQCIWTSNVLFWKEKWINPLGTNAHELRMIPVALHDNPQDIINQMYEVDRQRAKHFPDFATLLPDTYGSKFYFDHCPEDIINTHTWTRIDSKDPSEALPEYLEFLKKHWIDPMTKKAIPSDGENARSSTNTFSEFGEKFGSQGFGIWTSLSNNTKGSRPRETEPFGPFWSFSVVIKPKEVQRPDGSRMACVKLTDNPNKIFWYDEERNQHIKEVFGEEGMTKQAVLV